MRQHLLPALLIVVLALTAASPAAAQDALRTSKDIVVEAIPAPRTAAPGGAVKLMYTIFNYEETDERVRLRIDEDGGWQVVDPAVAAQEFVVDALDVLEGELYVRASESAPTGQRQRIRLLVEVVRTPGLAVGQNYVSIVKRGSASPDAPSVEGSTTVGLSGIGGKADRATAFTMATTFARESSLTVAYERGLRDSFSSYRYEQDAARITGAVRHGGWGVSFGNAVSSPGHAVVGPSVRGVGASVRHLTGTLVTDLVVAQPTIIGGASAGHLIRGRAGFRTKPLTVALTASDFRRPAGGYTTLSTVQTTVLDADAQEQVTFAHLLSSTAFANRVQGAGLEAEFQPSSAHRAVVRAGNLWLSNTRGTQISARVAEASHTFSTPAATLSTRWRQTPPTLAGISIPGDELALDGSVRVRGGMRVVGSAYRNATETVVSQLLWRSAGASVGAGYANGARLVEARLNVRDVGHASTTVRRTITVHGGVPVGSLMFGGNVDVGQQHSTGERAFVGFYRGDVRWVGNAGTASFSVTHSDIAGVVRQRADVMTSLHLGGWELAGGGWATRGYAVGGRPGVWGTVGMPIGFDSLVTLGLDYAPATWTGEPSLRGLIAIRKSFSLPLPFAMQEAASRPERSRGDSGD